MKRWGAHILTLVLLLTAVWSCGPRRIPRAEMESIIAEMLLQDQQIKINREYKRQADTSLVYEGIFQEHGCTTDEFLQSFRYYESDPSYMEKIMGNVGTRLEKEAKEVGREIDLQQWREKLLSIYGMPRDTSAPKPPVRPVDTLKVRFDNDSVWVEQPLDTLQIPLSPVDSL